MTTFRTLIFFTLLFLVSGGFALDSATTSQNLPRSISPEASEAKQEPVVVPDIDYLAINQEIKDLLDSRISHTGSRVKRLLNLHDLLFSEHGLAIKYSSAATKTAQQTWTPT